MVVDSPFGDMSPEEVKAERFRRAHGCEPTDVKKRAEFHLSDGRTAVVRWSDKPPFLVIEYQTPRT
jgi:hypothetical protein